MGIGQSLRPVDIGDDDPVPLAKACELLGPRWNKQILLARVRLGVLQVERIGNKFFTTKAALRRMQERYSAQSLGVEGNIYFVGYGIYVKIGYTFGSVETRVRGLSTASPEEIQTFATTRGTIEQERELHQRFAEYRLRGEWFRHEGKLAAHIKRLASDA